MHLDVRALVSVCVRGAETPCGPQMASLSSLTSTDQCDQPKSLLRTQDEQSAPFLHKVIKIVLKYKFKKMREVRIY